MPNDEQYPEVVETELPVEDKPVETANDVPQEGVEKPVVEQKPVWDGTQWAYQYKGQQIVPKSKEHLLALAQKGHGFNSEYDRLKQEREQFEGTRKQYDKYSQLDKLFQEHPELQQQINNVVSEYRQNPGKFKQGQGQVDPALQETRQIYEQTKALHEQLMAERADKALNDEIERLKTTYTTNDWKTDDGEGTLEKKILNHALKGNFPTLESAYRDYMWDSSQTAAKAEALKAQQLKQQADFKAGKTGLGVAAGPAQKGSDVRKMSYNQIADAIAKGELA